MKLTSWIAGACRWPAQGSWRFRPLITLAVLLPLLAAGVTDYTRTSRTLTEITLSRRETVAHLAGIVVHARLERLVDLGVSLATRVRFAQLVSEGRWSEAVTIMKSIPQLYPYVERLFLTDPSGLLMADTPHLPGGVGQSFAHRDWYQGVSRGWQPYVSDVYRRSALPQKDLVAAAVPVRDGRGRVKGILVLQVPLDALGDWTQVVELGEGGSVSIVDRIGRIVAARGVHVERDADNLSTFEPARAALDGSRGVGIFDSSAAREPMLVAFEPVPRYGWAVLVEQPSRVAFAARDAALRRILLTYALIALLGGLLLWAILRAMEERRRAAEQIRELNVALRDRAVELEAANSELRAFSYSVAHDLRAPLRAMEGFGTALLEECGEALNERGRDYLDRVVKGSTRMGDLIDALLRLAQLGQRAMREERIDLSRMAKEVASTLAQSAPERAVEWRIEDGLAASGDPHLVLVALQNLLSNAWKFTRDKVPSRIEVGSAPGGVPTFFVRDNGAGFNMEHAARLFGVFERLHSQDEFPGTGVGLATVKRAIQRHGGRAWAEGSVGGGATFYFTLPG